MFNPSQIIIDSFSEHLREKYKHSFGLLEPEFPNIIVFFSKLVLENIANSDAAYHDMDHTIMVTEVCQAMLRGKHLSDGQITPSDWLECTIAALCHDIGYVRGVCKEDIKGSYYSGLGDKMITIDNGSTDASLSFYHVDRSMHFVRTWLKDVDLIDEERIAQMIDFTRFPVPDNPKYHSSEFSYPGLLRAADLIGQLGDINYMRKSSALFYEFRETGLDEKLGYKSGADVRAKFPAFFWSIIKPLIEPYTKYLMVTQEGKQWLSNLHSHIFVEQNNIFGLGAERA